MCRSAVDRAMDRVRLRVRGPQRQREAKDSAQSRRRAPTEPAPTKQEAGRVTYGKLRDRSTAGSDENEDRWRRRYQTPRSRVERSKANYQYRRHSAGTTKDEFRKQQDYLKVV